MTEDEAQKLAEKLYWGKEDLVGLPAIDHPRRVSEAVSERAKVIGWLHDVTEDGLVKMFAIAKFLSHQEAVALSLLDRNSRWYTSGAKRKSYAEYICWIAYYPGLAGDIAREVKLADLRDNMTRTCPADMLDMRRPGGRYDKAVRILEEAMSDGSEED